MMKHHAYMLCGAREAARVRAHELHGYTAEQQEGNPDIQLLTYTQLGIDDARQLQAWAIQKPIREPRRLFIIETDRILYEAQNALLKLFEEPPEASRFILIVPTDEQILPTLKSRFEIIVIDSVDDQLLAQSFLDLSPAERLKEIAQRMKDKDTQWSESLLNALETTLYKKGDRESLKTLLFIRAHITQRGASPKMLLEHVALSLP